MHGSRVYLSIYMMAGYEVRNNFGVGNGTLVDSWSVKQHDLDTSRFMKNLIYVFRPHDIAPIGESYGTTVGCEHLA